MIGYINKVVELFTRTKSSGKTNKSFFDWLVDDSDKKEKNAALFHLWSQPNNITETETLEALTYFRDKNTPQKDNRLTLWRYAAAIAVLICATTAYVLTMNNTPTNITFVEHYSPIGKISTLTLPDGSVVETNSSTVVVYPENFGDKHRTLYLTGEANFKVVKNAKLPFIVQSKEYSVTALGTEFNVSSYPDDNVFKATLIEGSVKVEEINGNVGQILAVSEQFTYNKETHETSITMADIEDVTAWQRGELVFRSATIKEITKVLERKYGVNFLFKTPQEDTDRYSFRFKMDAPLPEVMKIIKNVATDFNYKNNGDMYYIY